MARDIPPTTRMYCTYEYSTYREHTSIEIADWRGRKEVGAEVRWHVSQRERGGDATV